MLKSTSRSKNWAYLLMHLSNTAGSLDCVEVGTQVFTELFSSTVIWKLCMWQQHVALKR